MDFEQTVGELAQQLGRLLTGSGETIAVAESVTCGRLVAAIGSASGASRYLLGGITTYTLDTKVSLLEVDRSHAASVNCVSAQVASEMASGVAHMFGSDWGIATTGYAEPCPAAGFAEPGAYVSLFHRDCVEARGTSGKGSRSRPDAGKKLLAIRLDARYDILQSLQQPAAHKSETDTAQNLRVTTQRWIAYKALESLVNRLSHT